MPANLRGRINPKSFDEIELSILDNVDYSVNLQEIKFPMFSLEFLKVDLEGKRQQL